MLVCSVVLMASGIWPKAVVTLETARGLTSAHRTHTLFTDFPTLTEKESPCIVEYLYGVAWHLCWDAENEEQECDAKTLVHS